MRDQFKLAERSGTGDGLISNLRRDSYSTMNGTRDSSPATGALRILHLEDCALDADLAKQKLNDGGLPCEIILVKTRAAYEAALKERRFDLILSDYSIPGFDGAAALFMAQEVCPDVPFVFCTGSVGEENATQLLKSGATDYVLKDRMARLPSAAQRALKEASERRQRFETEERMREQSELLDKATDAIYLEDLQHRITYWNKGAERLYGWTAREIIGRDSVKHTSGKETSTALSSRKQALETGEWTGELTQTTRDGRQIIVESRLTLVRDKAGNPKCILSINTDISRKREIESQFLRAQRMESIGTLAGGIAHDLNNHLGPIMMATQLLRMSGTTAEGAKFLETIETSARRGAEIVKQILSFARGVEGERVQLQLKHLVLEMAGVAQETFPRSIEIRTRIARDLQPVLGDSTQLHQILLNLCVNARDAMPDGGALNIEVENVTVDELYARQNPGAKAGPHVAITVSDTGTGIPPQIMDRIFDPFFTTKGQNKGTGLGLSTVMGIIRSHGGFITVQSELRKGTRFTVYLPAITTPAVKNDNQTASHLPRGLGELILIVDDEPGMRDIARQTLEFYGYRVVTAKDGVDALAIFGRPDSHFDLVLTDMSMPHLDGPSLIRVIQRMAPHVKIVAMTGMVDDLASGMPEIGETIPQLEKPFNTERLLNIVSSTLRPAEAGRKM
jgi:PAS domain S-box-containing protein